MEYEIRKLVYRKIIANYYINYIGHNRFALENNKECNIFKPKMDIDEVPTGEICTIHQLSDIEMEIDTCTSVS